MSAELDAAARLLIEAGWLVIRDHDPDSSTYVDSSGPDWCFDGWFVPYPIAWKARRDPETDLYVGRFVEAVSGPATTTNAAPRPSSTRGGHSEAKRIVVSSGPIPDYALLDVWCALGGDYTGFNHWRFIEDPRRTMADAWAQLMAAVRGDIAGLMEDTNPPAGSIIDLIVDTTEAGRD